MPGEYGKQMKRKSMKEIMSKIEKLKFEENYDFIVAIADGGIFPGAILSNKLQVPLEILKINFRDENQKPKYDSPKLLGKINFKYKNKKILIVDDVSNSGATLEKAKKCLTKASKIDTFVVNGSADYSLYIEDCFKFPWKFY